VVFSGPNKESTMPRFFQVTASIFLTLMLIAVTLWAFPVLAQDSIITEQAPLVAWLSGGGALASLGALAVTWGKTQQRLGEQDRRLANVETCAATNPSKLAALEAALTERKDADNARHDELKSALTRIESRLDTHSHPAG